MEQERPCCVLIVASGLRSVSAVLCGAGAGTGLAGAGIQPVSQLASCEQHGACNNCCSTQPRTLYAAHQGRTLQLLHVMARVSAVSCHARSILRRSRPGHNCNGKYLWKPF